MKIPIKANTTPIEQKQTMKITKYNNYASFIKIHLIFPPVSRGNLMLNK